MTRGLKPPLYAGITTRGLKAPALHEDDNSAGASFPALFLLGLHDAP
jgi:hypothetical protein